MEPPDKETNYSSWMRAINYLYPYGWRCKNGWHFIKAGLTYDLSAANITLHESIEANGHFLVTS